jgi:hypothetical protein
MTKFADQLLTELMDEYRPALERIQPPPARPRPRHLARRRPAWLVAGGATAAGAAAASVALLGGAAPAYAVTSHPDGTVTVAVSRADGIPGANAKLRALGDHVVVVPVRPGCPAPGSLPQSAAQPGRTTTGVQSSDGSITVQARGIPAGDTLVLGAVTQPNGGMTLGGQLITGPVPSCMSLPAPPASGPSGVGRGGGVPSVSRAGSGGGVRTSAQH